MRQPYMQCATSLPDFNILSTPFFGVEGVKAEKWKCLWGTSNHTDLMKQTTSAGYLNE